MQADTTLTQDHWPSLRRTGRTDLPLLRAVCVPRRYQLGLSCFHLFDSLTVRRFHHPSEPTHLRTRRLRPLYCGYVSRARRHTGIIILITTRSHSDSAYGPSGLLDSTQSSEESSLVLHLFIRHDILCPHDSAPPLITIPSRRGPSIDHRCVFAAASPSPLSHLAFTSHHSSTTYPPRLVS